MRLTEVPTLYPGLGLTQCGTGLRTVIRRRIQGPDGTFEVIEGTPTHPIWSVDRHDWVPLGELLTAFRLPNQQDANLNCCTARYRHKNPLDSNAVHSKRYHFSGNEALS